MIIECNVWCTENNGKLMDMGLPEGDSWMSLAIDFSLIEAIKLAGETEFLGNDKATIYFHGREVTIDITFTEAVTLWKQALKME